MAYPPATLGGSGWTVPAISGGIVHLSADGTSLVDGAGNTYGVMTVAQTAAAILNPRYHCHIAASAAYADDTAVPDVSGAGNHGVAGAALNAATLNAAAGYLTTALSANQMIDVPDFNFDWNAGERLFLYFLHKMAAPASNKVMFGHVASGTGAGVRLIITSAGDLSVSLFNSAGTAATGTSSVAGCADGTIRSFGVYLDGTAKTFSGWKDEVNIRDKIAWTLTGSTATAVNPRIGGSAASTTPEIIVPLRACVVLKFTAGDPALTTAQITAAMAKLRKTPARLLSKADLWGA